MQQKQPVPGYYYSLGEWNRLGCGPLPPERNRELQKTIERSVPNKADAGKGYN
jgi:hypothetical protein